MEISASRASTRSRRRSGADRRNCKEQSEISPRTVWRYMRKNPERPIDPSQRWMTFVRNHANALIACDFFVVVTATFRLAYAFVVMEIGTRRIIRSNVTMHPTAQWTLQQFRECVTGEEGYRFVIHDRDGIYSGELDQSLKSLGLTVLKTPYKSPQANAFCERLIGSARRECLDFMIPFNEAHIRQTLKSWIVHYNRGRPHSSLGPGMPDASSPKAECRSKRHEIPRRCRVASTSILGGLHHECRLERIAA
jgi:putative transposase